MKTIKCSRYTDDMLDDIVCSIVGIKNTMEALSRIQEELFGAITEIGLRLDKLEETISEIKKEKTELDAVRGLYIDDFNLPTRAKNVCHYNNIITLGDLAKHTRTYMSRLTNCGKITIDALENLLTCHGLKFGE